jgi:hypothetical protein
MSFGYVFVLPLALGVAAAWADRGPVGYWRAIGTALWTTTACLVAAFLFGWEGSICLIALAPVYYVLAAVGGILGALLRRRGRRELAALVLVAPFASAAGESGLPLPEQERVVATAIAINASRAEVWSQIIRVPRIREPQEGFFYAMGFPRPVEATLSHPGVGGVRHASFERGLLFVETIHVWEPEQRLAFHIEVDPRHTPTTTLDEHVTVGGRYFDVLEGEYSIEPLGNSRVRLHLTSRHRVSTRFNFYTSFWSDFLMRDIQDNILRVIKSRAEHRVAL